jgi:outer membrane protein
MKRIPTFLLLALCAFAADAQTQKGSFMLGGTTNIFGGFGGGVSNQASIGFGKEKSKLGSAETSYKYTLINVSPNVGYFVADGFLVGISVGILNFNTDLEFFGDELDFTVSTVTPMLRYYFNNAAKTRPYGEIRGGIVSVNSGGDSESASILGAKAGAAIFLNEKVSLDLFLDFSSTSDKEDGVKFAQNIFGFGVGFNVFL